MMALDRAAVASNLDPAIPQQAPPVAASAGLDREARGGVLPSFRGRLPGRNEGAAVSALHSAFRALARPRAGAACLALSLGLLAWFAPAVWGPRARAVEPRAEAQAQA